MKCTIPQWTFHPQFNRLDVRFLDLPHFTVILRRGDTVEAFSSPRGLLSMARAFFTGPRVPAPAVESPVAQPFPERAETFACRRGDVLPATPETLRAAFDYRGDVTLILDDDEGIEGYVANLREGELRLWRPGEIRSEAVATTRVKRIAFSGRDTASGRSFETWRRKWESTREPQARGPMA